MHSLNWKDSVVLGWRKHPGNNRAIAGGTNSIFLPGACLKQDDIPAIVDAHRQHWVGVDVANPYETYCITQLIAIWNSYALIK